MIPLVEVQPGVFVNIMHVDYFRDWSANGDKRPGENRLFYHLRDTPEDKWIEVHASLEQQVRNLIPHLTLRVVKQGPGIVLAKPLN